MTATHDHVPLAGSERRLVTGQKATGPASPREKISVTVQVRRDHSAPALIDLAERGGQRPSRRPAKKPASVTAHRAAPADLEQVKAFAQQHKLRVEESDPARRIVRLSGTVEQMEHAFGVHLTQYQEGPRTYRSRTGHIYVPRQLQGIIERVSGLTNRPLAEPRSRLTPKITTAVSAQQVAKLYEFPTQDCTGQNIALIELGGGYAQSDLDTYFGAYGLQTPTVVAIGVDGGSNTYNPNDPNSADGEVELDIELAGTAAQGATIVVYFAPNTEQGFIDAITTAALNPQYPPTAISISWGAAEDAYWSSAGLSGMDNAFQLAAAADITVLAASGDNGSNDRVNDGHAHCDYPASDPYVLGCGGTALQLDGKQAFVNETVWNNTGSGWATGGGVSLFPLPAWQPVKDVPHQVDTGAQGRGVPDVSGNADALRSPYEVVVDGAWMSVGGTSAVAPLYAGMLAAISAAANGVRPGFLSPYLYQLALTQPNVFYDVLSGSNEVQPAAGYSAVQGWDACSGIGRIFGNRLLAQF